MITFPECKINLGLQVVARREDGYHEICTLMYPVAEVCDAVEIIPNGDFGQCHFSSSGLPIDCSEDNNLCVKAYRLMHERYALPGIKMHLHKKVPFGAGLGGGSADAAAVIRMLNEMFTIGLQQRELEHIAAELGSDTVFFIAGVPAIASGRGEILTPYAGVSLAGLHLVIAKPNVSISTREAYGGIVPQTPSRSLEQILEAGVDSWSENLENDFESTIFQSHPEIKQLKQLFYDHGAIYSAMSGSGSAVFALFCEKNNTEYVPSNYTVFQSVMK